VEQIRQSFVKRRVLGRLIVNRRTDISGNGFKGLDRRLRIGFQNLAVSSRYNRFPCQMSA
jgi:hypothetical protein